MSDHNPPFSSTGVVENFSGDDDEYFSFLASNKPKPKEMNIRLESLPLEQIRESMETRTYVSERGSPELVHEVRGDIGDCPFCKYEHWDRFELSLHIQQHQEVIDFKQTTHRLARRFDSLLERQVQIRDSLERLKSESRQLDRQIAAFDRKSLQDRQRQLNELQRLLSS